MLLVRLFFILLIMGPVALGIYNLLKYRKLVTSKTSSFFPALLNSAVLYALAYNLIYFLQELFLVLGKNALGLEAYLYHNNHNWVGEHPMTSLMQGSGALAIFIIGILCLVGLSRFKGSNSSWRAFMLWMAFHGLMQSIAQVMVAFFAPTTDMGQALVGYLDIGQTALAGFSVISMIVIALLSAWFARPLLKLAPLETENDHPKYRLKYTRFTAFGAALLGSILIIPFKVPPMEQGLTPFLLLAFSVSWLWAASPYVKNLKATPNRINDQIQWIPIVLLLVLLVCFRFVLAPGIKF